LASQRSHSVSVAPVIENKKWQEREMAEEEEAGGMGRRKEVKQE